MQLLAHPASRRDIWKLAIFLRLLSSATSYPLNETVRISLLALGHSYLAPMTDIILSAT